MMTQPEIFQDRIEYQGDLKQFFSQACADYSIGSYRRHNIVPMGYEDLNVVVETDKNKYFAKIFASFRDKVGCKRYMDITTHALEYAVSHPRLFKSKQGYLYETTIDGIPIRMCLMEYIEGKSFYELNAKPTPDEMRFIIQQAALINSTDFRPTPYYYDVWAISNFLKEYHEKRQHLEASDDKLLLPLEEKFASISIDSLPHGFVHGDIIKTNVMKDKRGRIYIYDFSAANWYPRIQELAVILCNLLFDERHPEKFPEYYELALDEYQKHAPPLTLEELQLLPIFVQIAHAMHILLTSYEEKVNKNETEENKYFMNLGRIGLKYTSQLWKDVVREELE